MAGHPKTPIAFFAEWAALLYCSCHFVGANEHVPPAEKRVRVLGDEECLLYSPPPPP